MEYGNDSAATSLAYNQGWNDAFNQSQDLLKQLVGKTDGTQRFALIMASELLCHLANGRKVVLDDRV